MVNLLSSSCYAEKVPEKYVFPPEKRPGNYVKGSNIPVIDLHDHENSNTIHHIMKAARDLGLFQVINHGVPNDLMDEAMQKFEEVFNLPHEEKLKINKEDDTNGACRIFTSTINKNYVKDETPFWRDALKHQIDGPLENCIKFWPQKPENYRETVGAYVMAVKNLGSRIMELVAQGLGLERGYFEGKLSEVNCLTVNHYPACPNPSLTLGVGQHCDSSVVTILQQGHVPGLQLLKDEQWMEVEPIPHALIVIIGKHLEVVSNGKLQGGIHRAVTNASEARTSVAFFIRPTTDYIVEPAKPLIVQELAEPEEPKQDSKNLM